jgi:hypothetical protein
MAAVQPRQRLDLYENAAAHDKVQALTRDHPVAILHYHRLFTFELQAAAIELQTIRTAIDEFLESRPELAMHGDGCTDALGDNQLERLRDRFMLTHFSS